MTQVRAEHRKPVGQLTTPNMDGMIREINGDCDSGKRTSEGKGSQEKGRPIDS